MPHPNAPSLPLPVQLVAGFFGGAIVTGVWALLMAAGVGGEYAPWVAVFGGIWVGVFLGLRYRWWALVVAGAVGMAGGYLLVGWILWSGGGG